MDRRRKIRYVMISLCLLMIIYIIVVMFMLGNAGPP
jgi:hypothetical protein